MDIITVEIINRSKLINNRSTNEITKNLQKDEFESKNIIYLFEKINSEDDLIKELRN